MSIFGARHRSGRVGSAWVSRTLASFARSMCVLACGSDAWVIVVRCLDWRACLVCMARMPDWGQWDARRREGRRIRTKTVEKSTTGRGTADSEGTENTDWNAKRAESFSESQTTERVLTESTTPKLLSKNETSVERMACLSPPYIA